MHNRFSVARALLLSAVFIAAISGATGVARHAASLIDPGCSDKTSIWKHCNDLNIKEWDNRYCATYIGCSDNNGKMIPNCTPRTERLRCGDQFTSDDRGRVYLPDVFRGEKTYPKGTEVCYIVTDSCTELVGTCDKFDIIVMERSCETTSLLTCIGSMKCRMAYRQPGTIGGGTGPTDPCYKPKLGCADGTAECVTKTKVIGDEVVHCSGSGCLSGQCLTTYQKEHPNEMKDKSIFTDSTASETKITVCTNTFDGKLTLVDCDREHCGSLASCQRRTFTATQEMLAFVNFLLGLSGDVGGGRSASSASAVSSAVSSANVPPGSAASSWHSMQNNMGRSSSAASAQLSSSFGESSDDEDDEDDEDASSIAPASSAQSSLVKIVLTLGCFEKGGKWTSDRSNCDPDQRQYTQPHETPDAGGQTSSVAESTIRHLIEEKLINQEQRNNQRQILLAKITEATDRIIVIRDQKVLPPDPHLKVEETIAWLDEVKNVFEKNDPTLEDIQIQAEALRVKLEETQILIQDALKERGIMTERSGKTLTDKFDRVLSAIPYIYALFQEHEMTVPQAATDAFTEANALYADIKPKCLENEDDCTRLAEVIPPLDRAVEALKQGLADAGKSELEEDIRKYLKQ